MIHFDDDIKPNDARESIMMWLNRTGRMYTAQQFIDLGESVKDKQRISEALADFANLGMLKIDENKKIRLQGTLR